MITAQTTLTIDAPDRLGAPDPEGRIDCRANDSTKAISDSRLKRGFLIGCGTVSLALGILGAFLPLLPTTVFLLGAAWCYSKSSPRLYDRLLNTRWLGAYIRNYRAGAGIPARAKWSTLIILWASIGYSAFAIVDLLVLRVGLLAIAVGVTIFLMRLPVLRTTHTTQQSMPSAHPISMPRVDGELIR